MKIYVLYDIIYDSEWEMLLFLLFRVNNVVVVIWDEKDIFGNFLSGLSFQFS